MCDCFLFSTCKNNQKPLLTNYATTTAGDGNKSFTPTKSMTLILKSWLNANRLRYLILLLFSPLLIPIIFVISPFLFVAEVYFRFHRLKSVPPASESQPPPVIAPPVVRRKDDQVNLLDRYLDDQLELALEILDECGGELGLAYCYDYDYNDDFDFNRSNNLC